MVLNNLFAGQQWRNRHREQTYGHGERGGEGAIMERVTWKLNYHMENRQWEFAVCLRELKQGLCINLEGWEGKGDGREGLIHVEV